MDRCRLISFGMVVGIACLATAVLAHPHGEVEQQAHLTLASYRATVVHYLAAGGEKGVRLFDHLDTDGNGTIGQVERRSFGRSLIAKTKLTLDGRRPVLSISRYSFPTRSSMRDGAGVIRVEAIAPRKPRASGRRIATLAIAYRRFAPQWFIQPFLSRDLRRNGWSVDVQRPDHSSMRLSI